LDNRIQYSDVTDHAHTGDTNKTLLATYTIPAGILEASTRGLRVVAGGDNTGANGIKTVYVEIGGYSVGTYATTGNDELAWKVDVDLYTTPTKYRAVSSCAMEAGSKGATYYELATFDTAITQTINIYGKVANSADTVTLRYFTVELK